MPRAVRRRRSGAVMIVAVFATFLLASMVFYVFNIGRNVQGRLVTQHAADAAVTGGAGYVARSFNTVAMNNVEISRLIATVALLDAMPQTVQYTFKDQSALYEVVQGQLSRGTGPDPWVRPELLYIRDELQEQVRVLGEMEGLFNQSGYDVSQMTFYDLDDDRRGALWQAMEALDAVSEATMQTLPEMAQLNGRRGGEVNLRDDALQDIGVVVAPFIVDPPTVRTNFDDFQPAVISGRVPDDVDDPITNRGPYDTIFGWRVPRVETEGYWEEGDEGLAVEDDWDSPWSGGSGRSDREYIVESREVTGYRTYGPLRYLRDSLYNRVDDVLHASRFIPRMTAISDIKIDYCWPGSATARVIIDPEWVIDWGRAETIAAQGEPRVYHTAYLTLNFVQVNRGGVEGEVLFEDWGVIRQNQPWLVPPGLEDEQQENYMWRDVQRWIAGDPEQPDTLIERVEYRYYIWAGFNVGERASVRNPFNFEDREGLPAPTMFDHEQLDPLWADGYPVLAVAQRSNAANLTPQRFDGERTYPYNVALSQAMIFNNHSLDLWTQMWHSQLVPVQDYEGWVQYMRDNAGDAGAADVDTQMLAELSVYLNSLSDMSDRIAH
jgi:hypothetical protein